MNIMPTAKPLHLLPSDHPQPSWIERCCGYVPIIGWIITNEMANRRLSIGIESIATQLNSRSHHQSETNSLDKQHTALATLIARTIKQEFGWPNDFFLQEDPMELLLFNDDGESYEVAKAVEQFLRLPKGTITWERISTFHAMTFGQFVTFAASLAEKSPTYQ